MPTIFAIAYATVVQASANPLTSETPEVDLALVLAVDVSYSMDEEEQHLQREGFVEAFRSPIIHKAIKDGFLGRLAVTYVEWAGVETQNVVIPWTIISEPGSAAAFADRLARSPIGRGPYTSISGAIAFGLELSAGQGLNPTGR